MGGDVVVESYRARSVVNAAGCASDKVAAMVGDTAWHVKPRLGEYILLDKTQGHMANHGRPHEAALQRPCTAASPTRGLPSPTRAPVLILDDRVCDR